MDLKEMLRKAREREFEIHEKFNRKSDEYRNLVLKNDEIRRKLKAEEDELKKEIPQEHFQEGSEWSKVLEEIRVLERLVGDE